MDTYCEVVRAGSSSMTLGARQIRQIVLTRAIERIVHKGEERERQSEMRTASAKTESVPRPSEIMETIRAAIAA